MQKNNTTKSISNSLQSYLKSIRKAPLLNLEEEMELGQRIAEGDKDAREKLIVSNLRLVVHIAKKYKNTGAPLVDLIEEGNLALVKMIEKYDPNRGMRFSTYGAHWINQGILRSIDKITHVITTPEHINVIRSKISKARSTEFCETGENIGNEELSIDIGVSDKNILQDRLFRTNIVSIDEPIGCSWNSGDDEVILFGDGIEDSSIEAPDAKIKREMDSEYIDKLLFSLNEKEREVIESRFGIKGEVKTLQDIATKMDLTRERVRQIETEALKKLKRYATKGEY